METKFAGESSDVTRIPAAMSRGKMFDKVWWGFFRVAPAGAACDTRVIAGQPGHVIFTKTASEVLQGTDVGLRRHVFSLRPATGNEIVVATVEVNFDDDYDLVRITASIAEHDAKSHAEALASAGGLLVQASRVFSADPSVPLNLAKPLADTIPEGSPADAIIQALYAGRPLLCNYKSEPVNNMMLCDGGWLYATEHQKRFVNWMRSGTPVVVVAKAFRSGATTSLVLSAHQHRYAVGSESKIQLLLGTTSASVAVLLDATLSYATLQDVHLLTRSDDIVERRHVNNIFEIKLKTIAQALVREHAARRIRLAVPDFKKLIGYLFAIDGIEIDDNNVARLIVSMYNYDKAFVLYNPTPEELVDIYVKYARPHVVVSSVETALCEFQRPPWNKQIECVETVQVDDAHHLPNYLLLALLQTFPNARFALAGDRCLIESCATSTSIATDSIFHNADLRKVVPRVKITQQLTCPEPVATSMSTAFYDGSVTSSESASAGFVWFFDTDSDENTEVNADYDGVYDDVKLVYELIDAAQNSYEVIEQPNIGVICFDDKHIEVFDKWSVERGSMFFYGDASAAEGRGFAVVVVVAVGAASALNDVRRIVIALSRATRLTIVIGSLLELHDVDNWQPIVAEALARGNVVRSVDHNNAIQNFSSKFFSYFQ